VAAACLQGPTLVVSYGEFRTVINRYPGSYALESDGDNLRLVGDAVIGTKGPGAQLRAPLDAFLAELHATGRRALAATGRVSSWWPVAATTWGKSCAHRGQCSGRSMISPGRSSCSRSSTTASGGTVASGRPF
jgi:hypothetical protein